MIQHCHRSVTCQASISGGDTHSYPFVGTYYHGLQMNSKAPGCLAVSARPRSPYRKASAISRMRLRISYTVGATLKPQKDEDCAGVQLHNVQKCWRVLLTRCVKGAPRGQRFSSRHPRIPARRLAKTSTGRIIIYTMRRNSSALQRT